MKKTSIYLAHDLDEAIARHAETLGITKAEAIRRAIANEAGLRKRPRITAIGVGRGPGDVSLRHDEYLAGMGEE